jgi:hypothetical protein
MGVSLLERSSRDTASASLRGSAALAGVSACRVLKILAKRDRHMSHRRRLRTEMITGCGLQRSPRTRTPFSVLPQKRTQTTNEELVKKNIDKNISSASAQRARAQHSTTRSSMSNRPNRGRRASRRPEAGGLLPARAPPPLPTSPLPPSPISIYKRI